MARTVLITGGAGFIGVNAARYFLDRGNHMIIFDNFSRPGSGCHLPDLRKRGPLKVVRGDVRNQRSVTSLFRQFRKVDVVLHLASQVAVTTSVQDPRQDFEVNALGTLNVLEALRRLRPNAVFLYASTNKVYGEINQLRLVERPTRYQWKNKRTGVSESQPLDFHSPYGCSKGAADQYTRDYRRIYGLKTVVFRQSCIYGPYQYGIEDQGWVAWMCAAALLDKPITIYGDGKQVRDLLFVDDLMEAYEAATRHAKRTGGGEIYNIGGGPPHTVSVRELLAHVGEELGRPIQKRYGAWRPGDQRIYISDIRKARRELDWKPKVTVHNGIRQLIRWLMANRVILEGFYRNL